MPGLPPGIFFCAQADGNISRQNYVLKTMD